MKGRKGALLPRRTLDKSVCHCPSHLPPRDHRTLSKDHSGSKESDSSL